MNLVQRLRLHYAPDSFPVKAADRIEELEKVLSLYADPGFYHGCGFHFDRPTGGFDEDFSDNDLYDYPKPGKLARSILSDE